jgi:hypothetical protein
MSDIDKIIKQIYKYVDSRSILVIDGEGKIKRIFVPFPVRCRVDLDEFKEGEVVLVTSVGISRNLLLIFVINNKGYYYYFFTII